MTWSFREIRPIIARLLSARKLQVMLVPELEGEVIAPRPWPRIPGRRAAR